MYECIVTFNILHNLSLFLIYICLTDLIEDCESEIGHWSMPFLYF